MRGFNSGHAQCFLSVFGIIAPDIGTKLGRYEIRSKIGEGRVVSGAALQAGSQSCAEDSAGRRFGEPRSIGTFYPRGKVSRNE